MIYLNFIFVFSLPCYQSCCRRLRSWIEVAPYQPEQHVDEQDYEDSSNSEGLRVLACSISPSPDTPAFLAMLDGGGQVNDYLRLKYLLNRRNTTRAKEREDKVRAILCGLSFYHHFYTQDKPSCEGLAKQN